MAEQQEKAFMKQDNCFFNTKEIMQKKTEKGVRYYKTVGLGIVGKGNLSRIQDSKGSRQWNLSWQEMPIYQQREHQRENPQGNLHFNQDEEHRSYQKGLLALCPEV